jgi:hypothetical protein
MTKPSEIKVEKKKSNRENTPVRNPAFRQHEGLRELQKQLNSQRPKSSRSNK